MKKTNNKPVKSSGKLNTKHSLRKLYKDSKIPWLGIILGLVINLVATLLLATQVKNVTLLQTGQHTDLNPFVMYALVYVIDCVVFYFSIIGDKALITLTTRIRKKMWSKIVKISARDLEKESPSSLLSRITSDAGFASKPFTIITIVISAIGFIAGLLGKLKEMDLSRFGPFVLIGVLLALAIALLSVRTIFVVSTKKQNKISDLTKFYSEQLSNVKFIKASNGEERTVNKALDLINERYKAEKDYAIYLLLSSLTSSVLGLTLYASTFLTGIVLLKNGTFTDLSYVAKFYTSFTVICGGLVNVAILPQVFAETIGGTKKLGYIFDIKNEELETGSDFEKDDINLNRVCFSYEDKKTINDATMTFEKGKVTALVGPNGSGKSTLIKLLSRLYETADGEIAVGNVKSDSISLKSWRENFSVVSQNASLFSGTIKENILYGTKSNVTDQQIDKAIEVSGLTALVREKGLDYNIGVKGTRLSGGEQQRLAIARAFIADREYLILDEATANLDTKTEAAVIEALFKTMKGKTIIVIAHTIDVINNADNIIVLRDGTVEATGTKDEILKNNSFVRIMAN